MRLVLLQLLALKSILKILETTENAGQWIKEGLDTSKK